MQLPEFYETGMEFAARSVGHPQSAFRGVIENGLSNMVADISKTRMLYAGAIGLNTTVADDAHSFMSGYSEVVVHMRDLTEACSLETQFSTE